MGRGLETIFTLKGEVQNMGAVSGALTKAGQDSKLAAQTVSQLNVALTQFGINLNRVQSITQMKILKTFPQELKEGLSLLQEATYKIKLFGQETQRVQAIMKLGRIDQGVFVPNPNGPTLVPTQNRIRPQTPKENLADQPPPNFWQRLNPFGKEDQIDVAGLIKRAAVTIPVWFAMRNALGALPAVINAAIDRFKALDAAVAEMKVLTMGAESFENFGTKAKQKINDLSMATGKSVDEVKKLYTAFSETGIDPETAFAGMDVAAKGAISTMADSYELARVLAGAMNNLGDTIEVGATKSEKLEYMMALTNVLFKNNAGTVNEYAEALKGSVNAAANAGVSFKDLMIQIATLHTAMKLGAVSGNAIRMTLVELAKERGKVSNLLGRTISAEEAQDSSLLLTQVISKLKEMKDSGKDVQATMFGIFGARARNEVDALLNNWDKFKENKGLQALVDNMDKVRAVNMKDFLGQMATFAKQLERLGQIAPTVSQAFVSGMFGIEGKDAIEALKNFNDALTNNLDTIRDYGIMFKEFIQSLSIGGVVGGIVALSGALNNLVPALAGAQLAIAGFMTSPGVIAFLAMLAVGNLGRVLLKTEKEYASQSANAVDRLSDKYQKKENFAKIISEVQPDLYSALASDFAKEQMEGSKKSFDEFIQYKMKETKQYQVWLEANAQRESEDDANKKKTFASLQLYERIGVEEQLILLEKVKQYGIDDIQLLEKKIELLQDPQKKYQAILALQKEITAESQKHSDVLSKTIETSVYDNLSGKDNDILVDIKVANQNEIRKSISELVSSSIMSTGISDVFNGMFNKVDEMKRKITDPVIVAFEEGGKLAASQLDAVFAKWFSGDVEPSKADGTILPTSKDLPPNLSSTMAAVIPILADEVKKQSTPSVANIPHYPPIVTNETERQKKESKVPSISEFLATRESTSKPSAFDITMSSFIPKEAKEDPLNNQTAFDVTMSSFVPKEVKEYVSNNQLARNIADNLGFYASGKEGTIPPSTVEDFRRGIDTLSKPNATAQRQAYYSGALVRAKQVMTSYKERKQRLSPFYDAGIANIESPSYLRDMGEDVLPTIEQPYAFDERQAYYTGRQESAQQAMDEYKKTRNITSASLYGSTPTPLNRYTSASSVSRYYGQGNPQLPGIWGGSFFNRSISGKYLPVQTGPKTTSQGINVPSSTSFSPKGMTYGEAGYLATSLGATALTASSGVDQIKGGGAKNITQGIGTVAGAVGGAMLATGVIAAGSTTAMGIMGTTAAANFWNPVGWVLMAAMAVLTIASLFMKGPKQTSTQVQTSETKVGSKIDISNKKLELINRNLIALRNTMETYALATSSYFSEKQYDNIDAEFALSSRRSY